MCSTKWPLTPLPNAAKCRLIIDLQLVQHFPDTEVTALLSCFTEHFMSNVPTLSAVDTDEEPGQSPDERLDLTTTEGK